MHIQCSRICRDFFFFHLILSVLFVSSCMCSRLIVRQCSTGPYVPRFSLLSVFISVFLSSIFLFILLRLDFFFFSISRLFYSILFSTPFIPVLYLRPNKSNGGPFHNAIIFFSSSFRCCCCLRTPCHTINIHWPLLPNTRARNVHTYIVPSRTSPQKRRRQKQFTGFEKPTP